MALGKLRIPQGQEVLAVAGLEVQRQQEQPGRSTSEVEVVLGIMVLVQDMVEAVQVVIKQRQVSL